tara:strand:- start:435 stop:1001 length:567 start_codon:yes stop_codon:yes gene_type:complete
MKIKKEHTIFSNQVFDVNSLHVVDDHGFEVSDYLVVEPKIHDKNLVSGVAILPLVDTKIACIEIYRPALKAHSLEIPHGFIDENERPQDACARELLEETGIKVSKRNFTYLCTIAPDGGVIRGMVKLFFTNAEFPETSVVKELGLVGVHYFTPDEIMRLIHEEKITDSFTVVAFLASLARGLIHIEPK